MRRPRQTVKLKQASRLWRHFGTKWLACRVGHAARLCTGRPSRRVPATDCIDQPLHDFLSGATLAKPESNLAYFRPQSPVFFFDSSERQAYAPHWHRNAFAGQTGPVDRHWRQLGDFDYGDIRVFDYMAAGRPTILAIDGVVRQVAEAAEGDVLVSPGDDAALAGAVHSLSQDNQRVEEMRRAARVYVVEHFNRHQQAAEFLELVECMTTVGRKGVDRGKP